MITEAMKEQIQRELPGLLRQDVSFRAWLEDAIRQTAVTPERFDDRFDRVLNEFAADRAEQRRKWDEQNRKWDEQNRKWDEQNGKWDEYNRKWDEHNRKWEEYNRKWDERMRLLEEQFRVHQEEVAADRAEQQRKFRVHQEEVAADRAEQQRKFRVHQEEVAADRAEQRRKWDEQQRTNQNLLDEIRRSRSRQEQAIGALGARWGLASEHSFREALKGILERSFGVQVLNINEFDDEGLVFGQPDQVEIDVIVHNGTVILCELKASMSKADMYLFERKARFYEQRHRRPVERKLAVSPMVPPGVRALAERLGIEVFSYAEDVTV